jgi:KUP system potassium uptake protein
MRILHTSIKESGQIYLPAVNWALYVGVILAVATFGSSSALAAAYGISVSLVMVITTVMTYFVIRHRWHYPLWLCLLATSGFFVVDVGFFISNSLKIMQGGWFPIALALGLFTLLATWKEGRRLLKEALRSSSMELESFLDSVFTHPPVRVEGTAVFLTAESGMVPNAFLHNLKHNKVLHKQNLFVTVRNHEVPWIDREERLEVKDLGHDCWKVVINFGFMDFPDVPEAMEMVKDQVGLAMDPMTTSYFLSRDIVVPTVGGGMSGWREKLFAQMHLNASSAADFLRLPNNSVVELGSKIEI